MKNLDFNSITLTDGFWKSYLELDRSSVVWSVYNRFVETGRFAALACKPLGEGIEGPHIFWDSDVAKWIEGASYLLTSSPDEKLERIIDDLICDIAENQREDGYYNSYFLAAAPEMIFQNRHDHELYCLGHLIEAAIAYDNACGKDKLLRCMLRYVDLVYKTFLEDASAAFVTPGHEEIELALLKLYDYTGDEKHLALAKFFIDQRGASNPNEYDQSHMPVREMSEAVGHSVRACYLYTAMAMLAKRDGDTELLSACRRLFCDIVSSKMSVTGGIGSDHIDEKFSYGYNLPTRDTYNETCAAIALMLFASAMQETEPSSSYSDTIERILYNGFISGVSLDGEKYFYTNPLETDRKKYGHSTHQCNSGREKVFYCSCCPPNILRMLASAHRFAYTFDGESIYCNQFMAGAAHLTVGGRDAAITLTTDYPASGKLTFSYSGEPTALYVRIPDWCTEYEGKTEKGYARFDLCDGATVTLELPMEVHLIEADPRAQDLSGRYAVQRGPIVYCLEEIDNGENLRDVTLIEGGNVTCVAEDGLPAPVIYMDAERRGEFTSLYRQRDNTRIPFRARLIPYFAFANREDSDMIVWVMAR